jgi:hypothetical protein
MTATRPRRGAHRTTFLVAVFFVSAAALLSLAARPQSSLVELPLTEDGYYVLSVSRHIALGQGITIDGQQWTNGIQPLFAFLLAPVYMLTGGDRYASLRGVLAVHWLLNISTALLLGSIVRASLGAGHPAARHRAFWLTALMWLGSRYVLLNSYNGLETGCALLLYAAVWKCCQGGWLDGPKRWGLGLVLGLLVLARIDAAVFVATLAIAELARRAVPIRTRLAGAAVLALVPLAVSAPWWIYNVVGFGSLMPSSGAAQASSPSISRVVPFVQALLQVAVPYIQVRHIQGWPQTLLQACVFAGVAWMFARRVWPQLKGGDTVRVGGTLALSTLLLGVYYLGFSRAAYFYGRYLTPFMLVTIPMAAVALSDVRRIRRLAQAAAVVALGAMTTVSVVAWQIPAGVSRSEFYNDQRQLIEAVVPATDAVCAFQSGTIGYFRDRVVNLDGKVNPEALRRWKDIRVYAGERGIDWFCDSVGSFADPGGSASGRWTVVATRGPFVLCRRGRPISSSPR